MPGQPTRGDQQFTPAFRCDDASCMINSTNYQHRARNCRSSIAWGAARGIAIEPGAGPSERRRSDENSEIRPARRPRPPPRALAALPLSRMRRRRPPAAVSLSRMRHRRHRRRLAVPDAASPPSRRIGCGTAAVSPYRVWHCRPSPRRPEPLDARWAANAAPHLAISGSAALETLRYATM